MKKLLLVYLIALPLLAIAKPYTQTYKGGTMHIFKSDDGKVLLSNVKTEDNKSILGTSEAEKFKYVETKVIPDRTETMPEYGRKCTAFKQVPICRDGICHLGYVRRAEGSCD
ncbi:MULTISPECIES: hypothetical protein [unclassified Moraxella]|uniref:hypothetical protein n=1 Tax=unclassified Moraxella TaxID=2685852 RepID=UPI003AFA00FC